MAKLTEQEQQEIIRYLESGKPLPDKYRFLIFDDKREVELVWNGKNREVSNVVLPFQVIEQVDEPRSEKIESLQYGLFDTDARGRQLKGWTNKLIWGDNNTNKQWEVLLGQKIAKTNLGEGKGKPNSLFTYLGDKAVNLLFSI